MDRREMAGIYLDEAPDTTLRRAGLRLCHLESRGQDILRTARNNLVDYASLYSFRGCETVTLLSNFAISGHCRDFGAKKVGEGSGPRGAKVNLMFGRKATANKEGFQYGIDKELARKRNAANLIHADPGVTLRTVGHDAVVAGKSDDEASCKAVAIDCTNGRYWFGQQCQLFCCKCYTIYVHSLGNVNSRRSNGSKVSAWGGLYSTLAFAEGTNTVNIRGNQFRSETTLW